LWIPRRLCDRPGGCLIIVGEWLCAPLDTEQGGVVDDAVFADGTWETAEIPAARL
jgi:hypothetical protein